MTDEIETGWSRPVREGDVAVLVTVKEDYLGLVREGIKKFAKIASRHKQAFGIINTHRFMVERRHPLIWDRVVLVPYVRLGIQMPPMVGEKGAILAHFERSEDGKTFYAHVFDEARRAEAESFTPRLGECDHCRTKRWRKDVFVCETSEGVKIVGSNCLHDFLGIDPFFAVEMLNFVRFADSPSEDAEEKMRSSSMLFNLDELVQACYHVAKFNGGYSRECREQIKGDLALFRSQRAYNDSDSRRLRELNDFQCPEPLNLYALVDYVENATGDFGSNLRLAFNQEYVDARRMGLVLAGVGLFVGKAMRQSTEADAKAALPAAKLVDAPVAARVELIGTVLRTTPYTNDFGGGLVIAIRGDHGENMVHFYSGNAESPEAGRRYKIRATVKKHTEDKRSHEPQTIVSRASYKDVPAQGALL
jgi:hypothetical protein